MTESTTAAAMNGTMRAVSQFEFVRSRGADEATD
jgi:hypothetical protein